MSCHGRVGVMSCRGVVLCRVELGRVVSSHVESCCAALHFGTRARVPRVYI